MEALNLIFDCTKFDAYRACSREICQEFGICHVTQQENVVKKFLCQFHSLNKVTNTSTKVRKTYSNISVAVIASEMIITIQRRTLSLCRLSIAMG